MRRAVLALIGAALLSLGPAQGAAQRVPESPILVELFTAQGCVACPEANVWAAQLASRRNIIVLTYPVDYWDYLGWKDTLAHPAFAARQRGYRTRLGLKDVYTPQFIVEGRGQASGRNLGSVLTLIGESDPTIGLRVTLDADESHAFVYGGAAPPGGAEAWLIRYDPRILTVTVTDGENKGARVLHRNTVRELIRLGPWTGRPRSYALPKASSPVLRSVVVVQGYRRHGVLGAGRR